MVAVLLFLASLAGLVPGGGGPYHAPVVAASPDAVEAALLARTAAAFAHTRGVAPRPDPALSLACRAAADSLAAGSATANAGDVLRSALTYAGVTDAATYPFTLRTVHGAPPLADLDALLSSYVLGRAVTHVGVGVATEGLPDGERVVAVVFVRRLVELDPLPRAAAPGEALLLRGVGPIGHGPPQVLLGTPAGEVAGLSVVPGRDGAFSCSVAFDAGPGVYALEVLAEDALGAQVANLFDLYVGSAAPTLPVVRVSPADAVDAPPPALETRLLALVNRARTHAGLPPFAPSSSLTVAARRHSTDMARGGYFGHRSPAGGEVATRVARSGLRARLVSEVIAIAPSTTAAAADLLRSPSHRRILMDPRLTHLGFGVVRLGDGASQSLVITGELARLD